MIRTKNILTGKKRAKRLISVSVSVFLVILLAIVNPFIGKTDAAWFDDNFSHRTALTITNTGSADANKKVKFDIDTATLITAGKMQSDCGDSRFTDNNGKTLQYYLDTTGGACNTNSTDYYVLLPVIPVGSSVIYHYYGNPQAVNGTATAQFSQSTFSPNSSSAASEEKGPSPAMYLKFDEGNGSTANDSTSNRNTGTVTAATWQPESQCVVGNCLKFDGNDDYVTVSNSSSLSYTGDKITLAAWIRPGSTVGTVIVGKPHAGSHTDPYFKYVLYYDSAPYDRQVHLRIDNTIVRSSRTCPQNQWCYVVGVYDGSTIKIYINGKEAGSTAKTGNIQTSSESLFIGRNVVGGEDFNGFIDEVKLFPYARSASQVLADYNGVSSEGGSVLGRSSQKFLSDGLVGYWKMDESSWNGTSGEAVDSSGVGNNGTATNGSTTTTGRFGLGGSFDGTNDYVNVPDSSTLVFTNSGLTTSAWIKMGTTGAFKGIVTKWECSTNTNTEYQFIVTSGDKLSFSTVVNSSTSNDTIGATSLTTGVWYHVVATYNDVTKETKLFLNGQLDATSTHTGSRSMVDGTLSTRIGGRACSGGDLPFNGQIDDARIYNRVLSAQEVSSLYNFAPSPTAHYPFDEGRGTTVSDKSGNGANLSFSGNASWARGRLGYSLKNPASPAGNSSGASVSDPSSLNFTTNNITLGAWVYFQSGNQWNNGATIVGKFNCCGSSAYKLYVDPSDSDKIVLSIIDNSGAGNDTYSVTTSSGIPRNKWVHVEAVFDRTSSTSSKIFVNGIEQSVTRSGTIGNIGSLSDSTPLYVGTQYYEFGGMIDEVKIYNYARSHSQVIEDMNGNHPVVAGARSGGLAAYWKMDEGTGTTIKDSSGNDKVGTLTNMSTAPSTATSGWSNGGKFHRAVLFDGSDDYIALANSTSLSPGSGDMTISAWVNTSSLNGAAHDIYRDYGTGGNHVISLGLNASNRFSATFRDGDADAISPTSTRSLSTGVWYHVVGVKKGTTGYVYVNGVLDATNTNTSTGSVDVSTGDVPTIGKFNYNGVSDLYWHGILDEIKIYGYALSAEEVKLDYNRGASQVLGSTGTTASGGADNSAGRAYCPPGDTTATCSPVAEWNFEEGSGTSLSDTAGNGNTATITSGGSFSQGKVGKALRLGGSSNSVSAASSTSLNLGTSDFTLQGWVKGRSMENGDCILCKTNGGGASSSYGYHFSVFDSLYPTLHFSSGATAHTKIQGTQALVNGRWYHVAVVVDRDSTSNTKVYINGVPVTTNVSNLATNTGSITNSLNLAFGSESDGSYDWDGELDQMRIFNYARSASQVAWDYNRGAPVAHWKMDECQGSTVNDSSENGTAGTITVGGSGSQTAVGTCQTSSTAWGNGATGKLNSGIRVDGTDDYIDLTDKDVFTPSSTGFAVSAWVKYNSFETAGSQTRGTIVAKTPITGSGNWEWVLEASNYSGTTNPVFRFHTMTSGGSTLSDAVTNVVPTVGQWYHIVGTLSSSGQASTYINGKLWATGSTASFPTNNSDSLKIGVSYGASNRWDTNAVIDDVRIYNYTLTGLQVKDLYTGGAVRFAPVTGTP